MTYIYFKNKRFAFTGTLKNFTREQATELIEQRGGIVKRALTKSVHYVIVGDNPGATKMVKLQKWNYSHIKKVTETEFAAALLTSIQGFRPRKATAVAARQRPVVNAKSEPLKKSTPIVEKRKRRFDI